MKKKIRDKNIAEGLSDLVVTSDLANQNVFDSSKKDTHLQNENERRLNEKFVSFTGGKMVAESGHGKAKNVKEVDLDKIDEGVVTEDVMLDLKKEIVNNQGEKARNVFHVQFADRKSGQKLSGAVGRQKVMEQQRGLHDEIAEDVQARMVASGEKMDKAKAEKLRRVVEKDKLKVDLKEAA